MSVRLFTLVLLPLCLAMVIALLTPNAGSAQGQEPFVDLAVTIERGRNRIPQVNITNLGNQTAYGIRVEIDHPGYTVDSDQLSVNIGTIFPSADDSSKAIWEVEELAAGETVIDLVSQPKDFPPSGMGVINTPGAIVRYVVTVTHDFPADSDLRNNDAEFYAVKYIRGGLTIYDPVSISVETSIVSDTSTLEPGDDIVFEIKAIYNSGVESAVVDNAVNIQLPTNVVYKEHNQVTNSPVYNPITEQFKYVSGSGGSADQWKIGDSVYKGEDIYTLTLTATLTSEIVVGEHCLTAEISGTPSEVSQADREDNFAVSCLELQQPVPTVLSDGEVSLFTWYDCVGQTNAYPCDSANNANSDGLEVVVVHGIKAAGDTISPEEILQPGDFVVHVPDPLGRNVAGGNIFWSTGYSHSNRVYNLRGVRLIANTNLDATQWGVNPNSQGIRTKAAVTGSVSGAGSNPAPGVLAAKWRRSNGDERDVWPFTNGMINSGTTGTFGFPNFPIYFTFDSLGTYEFEYTVTACYGAAVCRDTDNTNDVNYSDTETYTFRVGPMADLAVQQAWQTLEGVEVAVVNHGPDASPGARVELDTGESCTLGPIPLFAETAAIGILTCTIADAQVGNSQATVTVVHDVPFEACANLHWDEHAHDGSGPYIEATEEECVADPEGSWLSLEMYDHDPNNDTKVLSDTPPVPATARAQRSSMVIQSHRVNWEPVAELYGLPVSHYEVERLDPASGRWKAIAVVSEPPYDDTDEDRGSSPRYRVRAVNTRGQWGPWAETGVSSASSLPRLTLSVDPATINEPDGQATVTARLNKASGRDVDVTVSAELASGTDTPEQPSFTLSDNKQLMIPAGMLESTGAVTISANADDDGLNGQVRVSAVAAYVQPNIPAVTLTIQDDDAPDLVLSALTPPAVPEGGESTYTVALNAQPSGNVHVRLYRGNNDITVDTDTGAGGVQDTLVFTPDDGNWNRPRTVTVRGVEDEDAADESTTIRHSILDSPSAREYRSVADVTLNVTVTDNDTGRVGVKVEPLTLNVTEGQSGKTYKVSLGTRPSGNVYITAEVIESLNTGSTGVRVSPATIVLNSNNWSPGRTVTVSAVRDQDGADEMNTKITHMIDTERTTATEYLTWYEHPDNDVDSVTVNVSDVDKPGVQVSPETLRITEGRSGSYSVKLNTQPAEDETVTVSVRSDDRDVTVSPGKLTFTSTNWSSNQRVTVTAKTDVDAADDTTMLRHEMSSTDSASAYNGPSDVTVTVTVTDPDRPGVTIGPLSPTPVYEAGWRIEKTEMVEGEERSAGVIRIDESCTGNKIECDGVNFDEDRHPSFYTVRLDTKPTGNVVIEVKSDNTKVKVHPTSLTFTPDRMTRTVMVIGKDDADKDDEKATITHTVNAAESADEYDTVTVRSLGVIVDDKDDPGVTLIVEGPLELSEGGTAEYRVVLDSRADGVIVIGVESSNPGKVKVEPEFLWFSGTLVQHRNPAYGAWDEPQTITVTALQDDDGADETVTLIHKVVDANAHGWDVPIGAKVGEVIVTVRDDD